ncbi:MBL fold metallo-hydrolase [Sphingomonas sp.]|uniref:MBL fold metallo-hydrolase n=1 Tax=Sphingomonas sp. TaxID=28214 RepID=UPI0035BC613C
MKVRILGSGTSSGVPRIGNDWGTCDPAEPRNRRTRASILVEHDGHRVLVDTSPDMRQQLLDADVATVDAVVWTHDHADHCHGIDDLRQIFHAIGQPVRGLAQPRTLAALQSRFTYIFAGRSGYPSVVTAEPLPEHWTCGDMAIDVVEQPHGGIVSAGLRFSVDGRSVGYATDFHAMTAEMRTLYTGLDLWIVDALRRRPHPSHPDLDTVLAWVEELAPRRTVLIHMDQTMDYAALCATLPKGVEPGYDGLEIAP